MHLKWRRSGTSKWANKTRERAVVIWLCVDARLTEDENENDGNGHHFTDKDLMLFCMMRIFFSHSSHRRAINVRRNGRREIHESRWKGHLDRKGEETRCEWDYDVAWNEDEWEWDDDVAWEEDETNKVVIYGIGALYLGIRWWYRYCIQYILVGTQNILLIELRGIMLRLHAYST